MNCRIVHGHSKLIMTFMLMIICEDVVPHMLYNTIVVTMNHMLHEVYGLL